MRLKPPTLSSWKNVAPLIKQYKRKLCRPRKNKEEKRGQKQQREKVVENAELGMVWGVY